MLRIHRPDGRHDGVTGGVPLVEEPGAVVQGDLAELIHVTVPVVGVGVTVEEMLGGAGPRKALIRLD